MDFHQYIAAKYDLQYDPMYTPYHPELVFGEPSTEFGLADDQKGYAWDLWSVMKCYDRKYWDDIQTLYTLAGDWEVMPWAYLFEGRKDGKMVFVTLTLNEANKSKTKKQIIAKIQTITTSRQNTPEAFYGCLEKTQQGIWHVHLLLSYKGPSGKNGLGASYFRRFWTWGFVDVRKVTISQASLGRILKYIGKDDHEKVGEAQYFNSYSSPPKHAQVCSQVQEEAYLSEEEADAATGPYSESF